MTPNLTEVTGDLFSAPHDFSLAHCVSADLRLGKGIAAIFKNKYGRINELKLQKPGVGGVVFLKDKGRFVYYLVTKEAYYNKPTYGDLNCSLQAMKDHMIKNGVNKLAIPRIGCGLDGMDWAKVRLHLQEVFEDTDAEITVFNVPPRRT